MSTFRIDDDKLDGEAIEARIRQRVREKMGVIYTEAELERLANLKLPSPTPPKPKDPDRDRIDLPELPQIPGLPSDEPTFED